MTRGNFESNKLFLDRVGKFKASDKILEIGSGYGSLVKHLKDSGLNVIGTEVNQDYIELSKENHDVSLVKIDGKTYPFENESFDTILSFDVFEHIKDSSHHLTEVKRILKPGGFYLLGVPNKLTNIPAEIIKGKSLTKWRTYHCSLYTYWGLKKIFRDSGFEIEFVSVPVINDYFYRKVRKIFGVVGMAILSVLNPDKLPMALRTNYYIAAKPICTKQ